MLKTQNNEMGISSFFGTHFQLTGWKVLSKWLLEQNVKKVIEKERLKKSPRIIMCFGLLPWSPSTRAPASKAKSPEELSFERVTVKPEVVVVLPQTYTPRGATLHTA